jgi:hypothetical protein
MEMPTFQAGRTAPTVARVHSAGEVPRHGASGIEVYTGNWQSLTGKRQTKQKGEVKRVVLNPCLRKSDQAQLLRAEMSQIDVNEKPQLVNMVSNAERQRRSRNWGVFSDVEGADAGNVGRYSYARGSPQIENTAKGARRWFTGNDVCRFYSSRELFLKIDSEASPSRLNRYDEQSV